MKKNGAQILTTLLERQGITLVAGLPGGPILPLYDALQESSIEHILVRHEQAAGFIAQGMARVTGRAAVCMASSGPGATNLLTAVADAHLDSIPMVAITAQVPQSLIGTDAFQEVDTYGLMLPITKHNFLVRTTEELLKVVPLAFEIAESGRPGPVSIDIPKDVLTGTLEIEAWPEPGRAVACPAIDAARIADLAALISSARSPIIYLGGGVITANASGLAHELVRRIEAPVVSTLMALGAIPADEPLNMGMLGMHGSRATNFLLEETDLLIAIGARFDDRATGKAAEFCPTATIVHIDIDQAEFGKIKQPFMSINGDAADILRRLLAILPAHTRPTWRQRTLSLKASHALRIPDPVRAPLDPLGFCRSLADLLPSDALLTTDVGQHQMWVAQAYPVPAPRSLLTAGGLGSMGFGLPAAIGAALAAPGRKVACITGDGSIMMNIQELATLAELNLPVAVIIMNNNHLGLVRQQQELFYGKRYHACKFSSRPDFAAIAQGFGVRGVRIDPHADPLGQLRRELALPGPVVIDLPIEELAKVLPMVPPGAANRTMIEEPALADS